MSTQAAPAADLFTPLRLVPPSVAKPPVSKWRAEGQVAALCAADLRRHALTLPEDSDVRADLLEGANCWTLLAGMRGVDTAALRAVDGAAG